MSIINPFKLTSLDAAIPTITPAPAASNTGGSGDLVKTLGSSLGSFVSGLLNQGTGAALADHLAGSNGVGSGSERSQVDTAYPSNPTTSTVLGMPTNTATALAVGGVGLLALVLLLRK